MVEKIKVGKEKLKEEITKLSDRELQEEILLYLKKLAREW